MNADVLHSFQSNDGSKISYNLSSAFYVVLTMLCIFDSKYFLNVFLIVLKFISYKAFALPMRLLIVWLVL